ncbi:DUF5309 domain-containing protein [Rhodospirillaceae bacterium SYSU D60014]|uniref:DUF5309 domain-containing protein n=1 Tax=Virgifigura deserti TaxID=2268457 RepID=UPI000E66547F
MGQPTHTFDSYDSIGDREDLSEVIYNLSPTQTPFLAMAQKLKAKNTLHEWQTDSLASPDESNAVIEGDDASLDDVMPTARVGNYTQISDKTVVVSGTQEATDKAGRKSELSYQIAKKGKELKRDMEAILTRNQASVGGSSSVARTTGSVEAWLTSNVSRGTGGLSGGFSAGTVSVATDGTERPYTEDLLKEVIQSCWSNGGDPSTILVGPKNKAVGSSFAGIATQYRENSGMKQATIIAGADVYVSDFGEHKIVASRFSRDRSALVLDMEYWGVAYLRPFQQHTLSKTGDSEKRQLLAEYALVAKQEAASGVVADLTTP